MPGSGPRAAPEEAKAGASSTSASPQGLGCELRKGTSLGEAPTSAHAGIQGLVSDTLGVSWVSLAPAQQDKMVPAPASR